MNDLIEACHHNLQDCWKVLASNPYCSIIETSDYIGIKTDIEIPLFNPIFLKKMAQPISLPKNSTHSLWFDPLRNQSFMPETQALELIMHPVPMMAIPLDRHFQISLPENVTIRLVENNKNLTDWIHPIQISFGMNEKAACCYQQYLEHAGQQLTHFAAYKNNKIIGTASLFLHDEIAGLYNLSVLPEFRKQGIASALHSVRLNMAREKGYDYATLQATPMATELDKSFGFKTLVDLSIYQF